ncbi:MAG: MGMT family protein [Frankiales bacterium]|nr:MGMT family protein [Frankiales bacterium]
MTRRAASVSAGLAVRGGSTPTAYARLVLDVVDRIPPGCVLTYGDVAELMGRGTGRTVGTVLSRHGQEVQWQRVVQASGRPAEPHLQQALGLLAAEGCPLQGERVVLERARWDGRNLAAFRSLEQ